VDELRDEGLKAGLVRIRYMRPFPVSEISAAVKNAKALAVLEKDVSFGAEGTVYTNVNSALKKNALEIPSKNFIGGLGGKDISLREIKDIFLKLKDVSEGQKLSDVNFLGVDVKGE